MYRSFVYLLFELCLQMMKAPFICPQITPRGAFRWVPQAVPQYHRRLRRYMTAAVTAAIPDSARDPITSFPIVRSSLHQVLSKRQPRSHTL